MGLVDKTWIKLYNDFFDFMEQEHGLILTHSEMDEIMVEAMKLQENLQKNAETDGSTSTQNCRVKGVINK